MAETAASAGKKFWLEGIPSMMYGGENENAFLFVHGKMGNKTEGEELYEMAPNYAVMAMDLPGHGKRGGNPRDVFPWVVVPEIKSALLFLKERYKTVSIYGVSIGAWLSMIAAAETDVKIERAIFISPVLDMEGLIHGLMRQNGITEEALRREGEIQTIFEDTVSYRYLEYTRSHKLVPPCEKTTILYGTKDHITSLKTVKEFSKRYSCKYAVIYNAPHWIRSPDQVRELKRFVEDSLDDSLPFLR